MSKIYSNPRWQATRSRALRRDGNRCTVARLLGGECSRGPLHAHHIVPVSEGGAPFDLENVGTSCAAHHPMWEALRRQIVARLLSDEEQSPPRCTHRHASSEARAICERRLARQAERRQLVA